MAGRDKSKHYENLIRGKNPLAAAIGRRIPYHLEYIRKHSGSILLPDKAGCTKKESVKKS